MRRSVSVPGKFTLVRGMIFALIFSLGKSPWYNVPGLLLLANKMTQPVYINMLVAGIINGILYHSIVLFICINECVFFV